MLMGGGWSQEELHPPPKGLNVKKLERETKGKRDKIMLRGKLVLSFMSPMWVYISTFHEGYNPRTSHEGCRLVT